MNKRERLEATIQGEATDRTPVALWRHFPGDDYRPEDLAASVVGFQRRYDFDFVKVTPASSYSVADWGVRDEWRGNEEGTRLYTYYPIRSPDDWKHLAELDVRSGALGAQLKCLDLIRRDLDNDVPVIQTVFAPLGQAKHLAGERAFVHLRQNPAAVKAGLETITRATIKFVKRRPRPASRDCSLRSNMLAMPRRVRPSMPSLAKSMTCACWRLRGGCGSTWYTCMATT